MAMAKSMVSISLQSLSVSPSSTFRKIIPSYISEKATHPASARPVWRQKRSMAAEVMHSTNQRTANYQPSSWSSYHLIGEDDHSEINLEENDRRMKLEDEVRRMVDDEEDPTALLELMDDIHGLGLAYLYRETTKRGLERLKSSKKMEIGKSLHTTALYFKLLRQNGHQVDADIFECFKDKNGKFKASLANDTKGLLSLFEASQLGFEGEDIMDEAKSFSTLKLISNKDVKAGLSDAWTAQQISEALQLPSHHRMQRLQARWNIEAYGNKPGANQVLLTLAKLDYNMVQSSLQSDLRDVARWWREVGLADKLSFARDRLMECFFWATGLVFEPRFSKCRKALTKAAALITVIDDVYDIYGSPEQLQLFTDAVDKWDVNSMENLPDYMKICFLALYNTVNELAYETLKEQGLDIIPHLSKAWAEMFKAFLKEADWNRNKNTPSFDEYLCNGWISSSGATQLVHVYYLVAEVITGVDVDPLNDSSGLLRWPSTVFRLSNDLSSSKAEIGRGKTINAISCYMQEANCSEEQARRHISKLIDESWKKMNKQTLVSDPTIQTFAETSANLARIAQCVYQFGDSHSDPDDAARNRVLSVIFEPIQLN